MVSFSNDKAYLKEAMENFHPQANTLVTLKYKSYPNFFHHKMRKQFLIHCFVREVEQDY